MGDTRSVHNPYIPKAHTRSLTVCTTEVELQMRNKYVGLGCSRFARRYSGNATDFLSHRDHM